MSIISLYNEWCGCEFSQVWLGVEGEWRSMGKPARLPDGGGLGRPHFATAVVGLIMEDR